MFLIFHSKQSNENTTLFRNCQNIAILYESLTTSNTSVGRSGPFNKWENWSLLLKKLGKKSDICCSADRFQCYSSFPTNILISRKEVRAFVGVTRNPDQSWDQSPQCLSDSPRLPPGHITWLVFHMLSST